MTKVTNGVAPRMNPLWDARCERFTDPDVYFALFASDAQKATRSPHSYDCCGDVVTLGNSPKKILQPEDINVVALHAPEKVVTVTVRYQTQPNDKPYCYLAMVDAGIAVGDFVIVPVSGKNISVATLTDRIMVDSAFSSDQCNTHEWVIATATKVEAGYTAPKDSHFKLRWAIGKLPTSTLAAYAKLLSQDSAIIDAMRAAIEKEAADARRQAEVDAIPEGSKAAIWDIMGITPAPVVSSGPKFGFAGGVSGGEVQKAPEREPE